MLDGLHRGPFAAGARADDEQIEMLVVVRVHRMTS